MWAECRAAPKPAHIPSGDRLRYAAAEGLSCHSGVGVYLLMAVVLVWRPQGLMRQGAG